MHLFTTLFILAATAAVPNSPMEPVAAEVYRCDFETDQDRNYDGWPDGWARRRDRNFPDYVRIAIVPAPAAGEVRAAAGKARSKPSGSILPSAQAAPLATAVESGPQSCLAIELDGGAGSATSPSIAISNRYSFILEGRIRTEGLRHDAARISLTLYDDAGELLETHDSPPILETTDWQKVRVGPIAPQDVRVRFARISLSLQPRDLQEDLTGFAWFDDLKLFRVPRMKLRTANGSGLYPELGNAEVLCDVSGVSESDPQVTFELFDHAQTRLVSETLKVAALAPRPLTTVDAKAADEPFAGSVAWKPPLPDYGFYRIRVTMPLSNGSALEREVTLAALRPLTGAASGEFGWSLPNGEEPLTLDELGPLLGNVGIHWAKFPVWHHGPDDPWTDRLAWFAERLSLQGIEMVGLLDNPPAKPGDTGRDKDQPAIASLFIEPGIWDDAVAPVMTRLSLKVRWWQLGGDNDTSFVGLPNVEMKISEVKRQFERFGQEVRLGIPWRWINEPPAGKRVPWEFLSLTSDPPLTAEEMALYLSGEKPPAADDAAEATAASDQPSDTSAGKPPAKLTSLNGTIDAAKSVPATQPEKPLVKSTAQRWVLIHPLDRSSYDTTTRVQDLVMRMLAGKIHGADAIFVPKPFDSENGLMNDDGTPGELLVPWRTVATTVSGSQYLGEIQLPGGSTNHVFARNGAAVMVVWNDQTKTELLSLGDGLRQMDLWGRELQPQPKEADGQLQYEIQVGPQPTIVLGLNEAVARWQIELSFDNPRLASIFGREQPLVMRLQNHFGQAIGGEISIRTPKSWDVNPRLVRFKLAEGDELKQTFPVALHADANSGPQPVQIDFEVTADKTYRFRVNRTLQLGLEGLAVEMTSRLTDGKLVIEQHLTNLTDEPISFQCTLFPPGRRRETKQVIQQGRGRYTLVFTLPEGESLIGQRIRLRAEEIGGARVLNHTVTAER